MPCTSPRAQPLALPSARGLRQRCSAFRFISRATVSRIAIFITGASRSAPGSCWSASWRFDAASPTPRRSVRGLFSRRGAHHAAASAGRVEAVPRKTGLAPFRWPFDPDATAGRRPPRGKLARTRQPSWGPSGEKLRDVVWDARTVRWEPVRAVTGAPTPQPRSASRGPVTADVLLRTSWRSPPPLT